MKVFSKAKYIVILLFWGCANMLAPTGGPADETPPVVVKSEPSNNQINYTKKEIRFTFDEYVSVDNFASELIVSPPLKHKPEFVLSKKSVIVTWTDTLRENTTYTFNLGNSIKDANEGNVLENLSISFSTGPDIDSALYSGKIITIDKQEPLKSAFVYLTDTEFTDSTFFPVQAKYLTKTNKEGFFKFQGVKPGKYKVYFLEDKNTNNKPDMGEYVGFSDTQITIQYPPQKAEPDTIQEQDTLKQTEQDSLKKAPLPIDKQAVFTAFPYYPNQNRYVQKANATSSSYVAMFFQPNVSLKKVWVSSEEKDSLYSFVLGDTLFAQVGESKDQLLKVKNSEGEILFESDTIKMLNKPSPLKLFSPIKSLTYLYDSVFHIKSNVTLQKIDTSKIVVMEDTVVIIPTISWSTNELTLTYNWEESKVYQITLKDSAIGYQDSLFNRNQVFRHSIEDKKALSTYEVKINRKDSTFKNIPLLVKINFNQESQIFEMTSSQEILFLPFLKAGNYTFTIYGDTNQNGIWDTGNISTFIQAEPIFKLSAPLEVKEGWDGDLEIEL